MTIVSSRDVRPSMLLDPYVAEIRAACDDATLRELKETADDDFYKWGSELHGNLFRFVRNKLGLWDKNHPLTRRWHEEGPLLENGVDMHPCHPDAVSVNIVRQLQLYLGATQ